MSTRLRRSLLAVVVLLVVLVAGVAVHLRPIAPIATGYAAKTICSGHFVSDRPVDDVAGDLPANPLVPFLRTDVDDDVGEVSTSLLGLARSTARFRDGAGCVLGPDDPEPVAAITPGDDWEVARDDGVAAALDPAFTEPDDPELVRGTRAVVVVHDGRIVAERYAPGFDEDTPLLGWSMGKSITNAVIGRLVDEGLLDLDDADLRPGWADDERSAITLDQLLRMSSGLAFEEVYDPGTDATRMLYTPRDTGAYAASMSLEHDPGEVFHYSSGTTNVLCDIAQDAAGADASLVRDLVLAPLGMTSAVMEQDASGGLVCSSFPYATARDWARFGQWFLQDGTWNGEQLLPDDWVEYSTTPVSSRSEDHPYGAQWWLNSDGRGDVRMPSVPEDAYWASGNEGQQVVVVPSEGLVVVRLGLSRGFDGVSWGLEPLLADVIAALP